VEDLLFLSQRIPYPPDKGDKIRSFHILKNLSESYHVHLGCFIDDPIDKAHVPLLQAICASVLAINLPRSKSFSRSISAFFTGSSISEACFSDRRMTRWVAETVKNRNVRKAFVFCSTMSPYALTLQARKILDIVDVDSEKWRAYAQAASWPMSAVYARESRKVLSLERRATLAFDRSLFVSAAEAAMFLRLAPEAAAHVLYMSNGVDLEYFKPSNRLISPFPTEIKPIVFTGTMNYRPNVDAVQHFSNDILPMVRAREPRAEFWIVGAQPTAEVRSLADGVHTHVTDQVPDIRPYLAHAACVVAPLRIARGVQNKVLEAFAMARAVVASPQACEGISAMPGEEILIAGNVADFADSVCAVLANEHKSLGQLARKRVETDYQWSKNLKILDTIFSSE
jgi:sugar transferase (PEP-CTERM/EpsH1 system associated)